MLVTSFGIKTYSGNKKGFNTLKINDRSIKQPMGIIEERNSYLLSIKSNLDSNVPKSQRTQIFCKCQRARFLF